MRRRDQTNEEFRRYAWSQTPMKNFFKRRNGQSPNQNTWSIYVQSYVQDDEEELIRLLYTLMDAADKKRWFVESDHFLPNVSSFQFSLIWREILSLFTENIQVMTLVLYWKCWINSVSMYLSSIDHLSFFLFFWLDFFWLVLLGFTVHALITKCSLSPFTDAAACRCSDKHLVNASRSHWFPTAPVNAPTCHIVEYCTDPVFVFFWTRKKRPSDDGNF